MFSDSGDAKITVVMGENAPCIEQVQDAAGEFAVAIDILSGVKDMATLMADCDVAISAGGSTVWELLCMRVPCILMQTADNQADNVNNLVANNFAIKAEIEDLNLDSALKEVFKKYAKLSRQGAKLVDGMGAKRVSDILYDKVRH